MALNVWLATALVKRLRLSMPSTPPTSKATWQFLRSDSACPPAPPQMAVHQGLSGRAATNDEYELGVRDIP